MQSEFVAHQTDHFEMERLLADLVESLGVAPRRTVLGSIDRLITHLLSHQDWEERDIFSRYAAVTGQLGVVTSLLRDHVILKEKVLAMRSLAASGTSSSKLERELRAFHELLRSHVAREQTIFTVVLPPRA